MKKFLLTLATAAMAATGAFADEVTFDFATKDYGLERLSSTYLSDGASITNGADGKGGDVTLTFNKAEGQTNGFRLWSEGMRLTDTKSKEAAISIDANGGTITSISLTIAKYSLGSGKVGETFDASTDMTYNSSSKTWTWTGDLTKPVIYLNTGGTVSIGSITINYTPSGLQPANLSFREAAYTVNLGDTFTAPALTKDTDAAVTYSSSDENVATVDASTGAVSILGVGETTITATTPATKVYGAGSAQYTLTVVKNYTSIADFYTVGENNSGIIAFPLTVAYQNGINTYVTDGKDFSLVYGKVPTYEAGDVIPAGWEGKYAIYNGVNEIAPVTTPAEATEKGTFTPATVTDVTADMQSQVVRLENVVFAEATPATKTSFTGKVGETSFNFYNNFTLPSVEAGTYTVTGAVSLYKGAVQLNVISMQLPAGLAFSAAEATATMGEEFTAPALTKATDATVAYTSSNPAVATVDAEGKVTLVAAGETTITATAPATEKYLEGEASYKLTVKAAPKAANLKFAADAVTATMGEEFTAPALTKDTDAAVTYTSSNPEVATVDAEGNVTLVAPGETTITATAAANETYLAGTASYTLTVKAALKAANLQFAVDAVTATMGEEFTAPALTKDTDATVTYTSSNPEVAAVDAEGNVTLVAPGETTITATAAATEEYLAGTASYTLTVKAATPSGVDGINAADGEAQYFNLQGQRIVNPESGLYIRILNGKVEKVIVK